MATGTGPGPGVRTATFGRAVRAVLACLILLSVGFAAGVLVRSHPPLVRRKVGTGSFSALGEGACPRVAARGGQAPRSKTPGEPVPWDPPSAPARMDPERLLAELSACVRDLLEQERKLAEEAKEGRIAYSLLRARGHPAESPVCESLVASQRGLQAKLSRLATELDDARRLEASLQKVVGERTSPPDRSNDREPLLQSARACVQRCRIQAGEHPAIPWDGAPDSFMGSKHPLRHVDSHKSP